jgi:CBS domain-containing protein
VQGKGEHAGHLDIKHGGVTIVNNLARVWAVRAGVAPKGTLARLEVAAQAGAVEDSVASELSEAFHFLWDVRLHHQVGQVKAGLPPDDFIDPKELASFSRSGLKEAFRVIARAQRQLRMEEGFHPR